MQQAHSTDKSQKSSSIALFAKPMKMWPDARGERISCDEQRAVNVHALMMMSHHACWLNHRQNSTSAAIIKLGSNTAPHQGTSCACGVQLQQLMRHTYAGQATAKHGTVPSPAPGQDRLGFALCFVYFSIFLCFVSFTILFCGVYRGIQIWPGERSGGGCCKSIGGALKISEARWPPRRLPNTRHIQALVLKRRARIRRRQQNGVCSVPLTGWWQCVCVCATI